MLIARVHKERMSLLATKDLTIRFGGHVAVNAVTCSFQPGTLTAIVGPNGAGKTTYFNLISGQIPATAGQILVEGEDVTGLPASARTRRMVAAPGLDQPPGPDRRGRGHPGAGQTRRQAPRRPEGALARRPAQAR